MDTPEILEAKANRLYDRLRLNPDNFDRVCVGANHAPPGIIHVYTKRKFKGTVPRRWEGIDVEHHSNLNWGPAHKFT